MRFKAKNLPLETGSTLVVFINKADAKAFDLHLGDRVRVSPGGNGKNGKGAIAAVDYASSSLVKPGGVGLSKEVAEALNGGRKKEKQGVSIIKVNRPKSLRFIKRKLAGKRLTNDEIRQIVQDIVNNELTDIELTYFVSACYSHDLSIKEITALTKEIVATGQTLKLNAYPIMDKHCIGGVPGNRTTVIVVPIIAAYGLAIPKTSSRAITSPAGTADTVEVFTNVSMTLEKMKAIVKKNNGCLAWGGSLNLAPADDKIIRVEHPLSIDATGMLLSSVLAKKKSVGATHILIDIPYGSGTKVEKRKKALHLKHMFEILCKELKMKAKVVLTDGSQPIGNGVGPLLEAMDILKVLQNEDDAPRDLKEKSIRLAGALLNLSGKTKNGHTVARHILESGKAYEKFIQIIKAQGEKKLPEPARYTTHIHAYKSGRISDIRNTHISRMAVMCGAPKTKEAGVYVHRKKKDKVKKGDILLTLYSQDRQLLQYALEMYSKSETIRIS